LVKTVLTHQNITQPKGPYQLLRALAIGSLIDAVKVFIDNEEAILKGKFPLL
jgi:dGTPase